MVVALLWLCVWCLLFSRVLSGRRGVQGLATQARACVVIRGTSVGPVLFSTFVVPIFVACP